MDGIDVALIETDGKTVVRTVVNGFYPYALEVRDQLKQAEQRVKTHPHENFSSLALRSTELHAQALTALLTEHAIPSTKFSLIFF